MLRFVYNIIYYSLCIIFSFEPYIYYIWSDFYLLFFLLQILKSIETLKIILFKCPLHVY
jgi:hypothetical protein